MLTCATCAFHIRVNRQMCCLHPLVPVDAVSGVRILVCALMRQTICGLDGDLHSQRTVVPFEHWVRPS